jgi:hypothetical protein
LNIGLVYMSVPSDDNSDVVVQEEENAMWEIYGGVGMYEAWAAYAQGLHPVNPPDYAKRPKQIVLDEWAVPEDLEVGSKMFDEFIEEARVRWAKGVKEYRNGDETAPFSGDPLEEASEEALDLYCYIREGIDQSLISEIESEQLMAHAFDAYRLIKRIQKAHSDREFADKSLIV